MSTTKRLYRIPEGKVLGGVCTGLGKYFEVDFVIIRLIWVFMILFGGIGIVGYIIAWILIPSERLY